MTIEQALDSFGISSKEYVQIRDISIIPNEENMRMYLLYSLKLRKDEIISNANGATEISRIRFRKMKVLVPAHKSLDEFEEKARLFLDEILKLELHKSKSNPSARPSPPSFD